MGRAKAGVLRRRRRVIEHGSALTRVSAAVRLRHCELSRSHAPTGCAKNAGGEHDGWKRHRKEVDGSERGGRDNPERRRLERPRSDAPRRMKHDGRYGRLDPVKDAGDRRDMAVCHVEPGQRDEHRQRRQHE